jgi:hypothetical protein
MGLLPIRVLLLPGGEPSFLNDTGQNGGMNESPFLSVDRLDSLPPRDILESGRWQLCVLPCELYLSSGTLPPGLPAIVFGPSTLALACLEAGASDFMRPDWSWLELDARLFRYWSPELTGDLGVYRLWGAKLVKRSAIEPKASPLNPETGLNLSVREASALRLFAYRSGRTLPFCALCGHEGNSAAGNCAKSRAKPCAAVAMMISRLRKKLLRLDPGLARNLRSARGQGYLWIDERIRQD